jgi:hypothetical protein
MSSLLRKHVWRTMLVAVLLVAASGGVAYATGSKKTRPAPLSTREVIATYNADGSNVSEGIETVVGSATCAPGEVLTGGGFRLFGATRQIQLQVNVSDSLASFSSFQQRILGQVDAWTVSALAPTGIGSWGFDARAICATFDDH